MNFPWFKKESPLQGLTGMWGGVGSNLVAGFSGPAAPGQQAYTTPGSYQFTVPQGVSSISVVCVGGGGPGKETPPVSGGGAGLGYKNNISVSAGAQLPVVCGAGGARADKEKTG